MHPADQARAKSPDQQATRSLFHPGLLWKEWHQHRYLFLLLLFLIMLETLFSQIYVQGFILNNQNTGYSDLRLPILVIKTILQNGMSFTESISIFAVVMLGAIMLGGERNHSLKFLAGTNVSRRQIIAAKWLLGNLAILICMVALLLNMYNISTIDPQAVPVQLLLLWGLRMTLALLFLFSLAMVSACIFSSPLYSAVFTGFFLMLPMLLMHIAIYPLEKFHVLSAMQAGQVNQLVNVLNIINYIGADGGSGVSNGGVAWGSAIILLIANVLCLLLSMWLFEHTPLERNGEMLMIGNSKEVSRLVLAILLAPLWAANLAGSWSLFLIYLVLLAAAIYLGLGLMWRLMASLGLNKNSF